jgi:hypothetical protein
MIKKNKIPTIIAIVILLMGTFAGVFYLNTKQIFRIGASATIQPKDVRVSNIDDNSATITWTTDAQTSGFLTWGESETSINRIEQESVNDEKFLTHSISISGLDPETNYLFKINSDGSGFDNNGVPWKFTTGPVLSIDENTLIISGSVINPSGQPVDRAIVYITIAGYLASTTTSNTGIFVYQLGTIRTPDLQNYTQIDPKATLLEISVLGGVEGAASAQIFPQSAKPVPPMVLGQIYDFRNLAPSPDSEIPDADLNLPGDATGESKFNIDTGSPAQTTGSVILESLDEGEVVTSAEPEFFGKGPPGETITIEVHSQNPIVDEVIVPNNGSWSFSVPTGLEPGAHTITITWKDTTGITRSLTRNFVVQASELPAFEATPSKSLSPSASPSSSPKATATPKSTATASAAPVPITGNLTPTFLLTIIGLIVIFFSFFAWKMSEE